MATDPKLGQLLTGVQQRDAIHIAIAAVRATERLSPGQTIAFIGNDRENVRADRASPIGIVDPFLPSPVYPGERFWMFLYPQTITSLRHDWTHPAFEASDVSGSERWLRDFAGGLGLTYSRLMDAAHGWLATGDYLCGGSNLEGEVVPDEFWPHYERVTGRQVPESERGSFFTCSC